MYLHIGEKTSIPLKEIIAILNLENTRSTELPKKLLDPPNRGKKLFFNKRDGNPRSLIVTDKSLFLSGISAVTLAKRAEQAIKLYDAVLD